MVNDFLLQANLPVSRRRAFRLFSYPFHFLQRRYEYSAYSRLLPAITGRRLSADFFGDDALARLMSGPYFGEAREIVESPIRRGNQLAMMDRQRRRRGRAHTSIGFASCRHATQAGIACAEYYDARIGR